MSSHSFNINNLPSLVLSTRYNKVHQLGLGSVHPRKVGQFPPMWVPLTVHLLRDHPHAIPKKSREIILDVAQKQR